jgi:hypothetical protein
LSARRKGITAGLAAALLASGSPALAQGRDGLYGRFDGDFEIRAHAGAAFASGGPALAAQLSAVYLSTAGVYLHYTDALGSGAPLVTRSISAGVHLQPLFLARFAVYAERGPAFVDLLVDSLAFELGAAWSAPVTMGGTPRPPGPAALDDQPGLEAALCLALPLLPRASGPFLGLRGALRWRTVDFTPGTPSNAVDRGAVLSLTLGWHQVIRAHLVDPDDRVHP